MYHTCSSRAYRSGRKKCKAHLSATRHKGIKSYQKGVLSKLSRDDRVYPRVSVPKRGTCSRPTFDHSFTRYTPAKKKKKNSRWLGGAQGARQTLQIFIWSPFDGEHGRRRRRKAVSPFLSMVWGGVPLFVKCSFFIVQLTGMTLPGSNGRVLVGVLNATKR